MATLGGAESFPIIPSLNKPLIVATHFGYSGHVTCDNLAYKNTINGIVLNTFHTTFSLTLK